MYCPYQRKQPAKSINQPATEQDRQTWDSYLTVESSWKPPEVVVQE